MFVTPNVAPVAAKILEQVKLPSEVRLIRAVKDLRRGDPVILVDDFDRENEADLIVAAEQLSIGAMAMPIRECCGIVCLCLTEEICQRLELPPMLRAAAWGILERQGHSERSVELTRLAGLKTAAVLCKPTDPDGTMAKGTDIKTLAAKCNMGGLSIAELVDHTIRISPEAHA